MRLQATHSSISSWTVLTIKAIHVRCTNIHPNIIGYWFVTVSASGFDLETSLPWEHAAKQDDMYE